MKALLLAPVAAMVVGILTAPSAPAYPARCPPPGLSPQLAGLLAPRGGVRLTRHTPTPPVATSTSMAHT
jgi:hypothetical protein